MTSDAEHSELLAIAESVALEAGALLVERPADLGVTTKSTPTDVVTVMDAAAERLLVERILSARPDDGVLGEEGGERPGRSGVRWVLDPIDGTANYLYDLPGWSVSVGVEVSGEVVAGVVHVPTFGETFTAVRRGGARRNGVRVRASEQAEPALALLATGFGYDAERRRRQAEMVARLLPRLRDIRRFGAASVDLCSVACGRVDAYVEQGLQPWDLAAGGLIAAEAGARVEGLRGAAAGPDLVIAAGPRLFDSLHGLLVESGVDGLA